MKRARMITGAALGVALAAPLMAFSAPAGAALHTCTSGVTTWSLSPDAATVAFASGDKGRSSPVQCMAIRVKLTDKDGTVHRSGWIVSQPPTVSTANGDGSGRASVREQREWATSPPSHQMHRILHAHSAGPWTKGL